MKIENTVFSKNNCEFYSRSIVSGWIGIIKMDKEDSNTFPEKKICAEMSNRYTFHSGDRMSYSRRDYENCTCDVGEKD